MRTVILLTFFICLCPKNTFAQCELGFNDILSSLLLSSTEFDTFVINKGFNFNSDLKKYACTSENDTYYFSNIIEQSLDGNKLTVTYSTHSKETYLLNKSQIEKTDLKFMGNNMIKNMNVFSYKHNNLDATLATETYDDEIIYYVSIQIQLTE